MPAIENDDLHSFRPDPLDPDEQAAQNYPGLPGVDWQDPDHHQHGTEEHILQENEPSDDFPYSS